MHGETMKHHEVVWRVEI